MAALERMNPACQVHFVSYGTGASTIAEFGRQVVDMNLPDEGSITDATVMAGKLVGSLNPQMVVSHEEFAALPVAKIFDTATAAILDFFTGEEKLSMQSLRFADEVLFTDYRGIFQAPPFLKGRVRYTGAVLRRFAWSRKDKLRARAELGVEPDCFLIAMLPGSWTEAMAPAEELLLSAFDRLKKRRKRIVWIGGSAQHPSVINIEKDWQIERLMVAADVAVTKTNRKTLVELESLGVPSVSLCYGLNAMDEIRARSIRSSVVLDALRVTPAGLAASLLAQSQLQPRPRRATAGAEKAAHRLLSLLGRANFDSVA